MPQLQVTPSAYLDSYVRPMAQALGGPATVAYDAFVGALDVAFDLDQTLTFDIPNPFPSPGNGDGGAPGGAPDALPHLQPIDPDDVLRAVAKAVRNAEKVLNSQNLAIGGASAEVSLVVQVGGVAGANATFRINIGPSPRP